jgi:hypothetical protein
MGRFAYADPMRSSKLKPNAIFIPCSVCIHRLSLVRTTCSGGWLDSDCRPQHCGSPNEVRAKTLQSKIQNWISGDSCLSPYSSFTNHHSSLIETSCLKLHKLLSFPQSPIQGQLTNVFPKMPKLRLDYVSRR